MAIITAVADGLASELATWGYVSIPTIGDTVVIGTGITVTVAEAMTVGADGVSGTAAVTVQGTGKLNINSALEVRGDIVQQRGSTIDVQPGGFIMSIKYCVLPGRQPLHLANTDGHSCIIGTTPRMVPEFFVKEAIYRGAVSEQELAELQGRVTADQNDADAGWPALADPAPPKKPRGKKAEAEEQLPLEVAADDVTAAIIELLNAGNPEDFEEGGAPKCVVLSQRLGRDISGPERDAAYAVVLGS